MRGVAIAVGVVLALSGCGALLGNDEDPSPPPPSDARSDGGDESSSADVGTAEGGSTPEDAGIDGASGVCPTAHATCTNAAQCCPGFVCATEGANPKPSTPMQCCVTFGSPCTSDNDCCLPEANFMVSCAGNPGQTTCVNFPQ